MCVAVAMPLTALACRGSEFEALYNKYEASGKARKTLKAQELWFAIIEAQTETGTPYLLYKDACNSKSNQQVMRRCGHLHLVLLSPDADACSIWQNLGTIKCSNLCTEIVEYTSPDEVAVCNLASIGLPMFIAQDKTFDHQKLMEITKVITRNLNKVIDLNYYPVPEARKSNLRHRPIGLGVQGLADVFQRMGLPFDSEEARVLNREIMETIYFGAVTASMELAREHGHYESYAGSPVSQGKLQYDMWGVTPSPRWDWAALKAEIAKHGVRNSLLLAPMPTASTSQILGNNECFEPYTSNIYTRRVMSGEYAVVNPHLLKELTEIGMWNKSVKNRILAAQGSIQGIPEIPQKIKDVYKTVWEMKMRTLIDMAADRGAFIDQSQSLNLFVAAPNTSKLVCVYVHVCVRGCVCSRVCLYVCVRAYMRARVCVL